MWCFMNIKYQFGANLGHFFQWWGRIEMMRPIRRWGVLKRLEESKVHPLALKYENNASSACLSMGAMRAHFHV